MKSILIVLLLALETYLEAIIQQQVKKQKKTILDNKNSILPTSSQTGLISNTKTNQAGKFKFSETLFDANLQNYLLGKLNQQDRVNSLNQFKNKGIDTNDLTSIYKAQLSNNPPKQLDQSSSNFMKQLKSIQQQKNTKVKALVVNNNIFNTNNNLPILPPNLYQSYPFPSPYGYPYYPYYYPYPSFPAYPYPFMTPNPFIDTLQNNYISQLYQKSQQKQKNPTSSNQKSSTPPDYINKNFDLKDITQKFVKDMKVRVLDINLFNGKPVDPNQLNSLITSNINNAIKNITDNNLNTVSKPSKPSTIANATQNKIVLNAANTNSKQYKYIGKNAIQIFKRAKISSQSPAQILLIYEDYLKKYKPQFLSDSNSEIYRYRAINYRINVQFINKFNRIQARTYNMGINIFSDLNQEQFLDRYTSTLVPPLILITNRKVVKPSQKNVLDWTCITSPFIQPKQCTASYLLSPIETIQMTVRAFHMKNIDLSIQQVMSCSKKLTQRCQKGSSYDIFDYAQNLGIGPSKMYPQLELQSNGLIPQCNVQLKNSSQYTSNKIFIKQFGIIPINNCKEIVNWLKTRPLSVSISTKQLQHYAEGIYKTSQNNIINHSVTLIGFHPDFGYLIKNTWGKSWGIQGYAVMNESPGICKYAIYATLQNQGKQGACPNIL